jgi:hypothetical protein
MWLVSGDVNRSSRQAIGRKYEYQPASLNMDQGTDIALPR